MSGDELRQIRERIGLSQLELAQRLHTWPNTISRYECGTRKINFATAELIRSIAREYRQKKNLSD